MSEAATIVLYEPPGAAGQTDPGQPSFAGQTRLLRDLLRSFADFEVEPLEGLQAWAVRGPTASIESLRDPKGPLARHGFRVSEDEAFLATSG